MKKIIIILISVFAFTVNSMAQNCNSLVDTTTKYVNCEDSAQLFSNYCNTSITNVTTSNLASIYFTNANTGYTVGSAGKILKTTNAGSTWSTLASGTTTNLASVCFTDTNTGYVIGNGGVMLKTTNAGNTWTALTSGTNQYLQSIYFTNTNTGYVVGNAGTILKTLNAGSTWAILTSGTTKPLNSVYFTDANTGYAIGNDATNLNGSVILKTTNAGNNWSTILSIPFSINNWLMSAYFTDVNTGYTVSGGGTIMKTTNAGSTWATLTSNTQNDLYYVCFTDINTGYAVGAGTILKTINAGINWTTLATTESLMSVYFTGANIGYAVGSNGAIVKINNNNATFSWLPTIGLSNPSIPNPKADPKINTTYKVTITPNTGTGGCGIYSDSVKLNYIPMNSQEICMVSIRNNKNMVMWDKPISNAIDSFYIWRETNVTGVYNKIGVVAYSDSSIFIDNTSNPSIQSNKYKLSIIDKCSIETNKSTTAHKTMHLSINQGTGSTWNLIWEAYEGFTINTYNIYRGTSPDTLFLVGTTSGSSSQYTDNTASSGNVYYQLQVVNPNACNPSKSYTYSKSNIATNNASFGISENSLLNQIKIYPNPANSQINVQLNTSLIGSNYFITDQIGKTILSGKLITENSIIELGDLSGGIYLLSIGNNTKQTFKVIKK